MGVSLCCIMPFAFSEAYEYCTSLKKGISPDEMFVDYINWGGLPQRFSFSSEGDIKKYVEKLDPEKDKQWNAKQLNAQILQGIMQGESIPKMAKRMLTVANSDLAGATRTARTIDAITTTIEYSPSERILTECFISGSNNP
mgnify:CR=1 FL=1